MKHRTFNLILAMLMAGGIGIAIAPAQAGDLLVSSTLDDEVLRYDQQTGNFLNVFAEALALQGPTGMSFGPDGHLYVAGQNSHNVVRFDGQGGAFIDEFVAAGSGGLFQPTALVFGPDDNLYLNSLDEPGNILRYDGQTGAFIDIFASGSGLDEPLDIAFGPDGHLYVASGNSDQVLRYDGASGAFIDVFAESEVGAILSAPKQLLFGADGYLYVTNGIDGILRYDASSGAFFDQFASSDDFDNGDMLFGLDGSLYIAAFASSEVKRLDGASGTFINNFISMGSGGLNGPGGLLFVPNNPPDELWSQQDGSAADDSAQAVAVGDGVYVGGTTGGTLAGQTNAGGQDGFLRKYDLNGNLLCTDQFGTTGDETLTGLNVTAGAVYLVGDTTGEFPANSALGDSDLYVRKYDLNCNPLWTTQFGSSGMDTASSGLGLSPDGSALFAGGTTDNALPGQVNAGETDAFIQRLDTSGNLLCNNQFGTLGIENGSIVLNSPMVNLAGTTDGALETSSGGIDGFIRQFNFDCNPVWTRQFGTSADDNVSGLGAGPDDSNPEALFVAGDTTAAFAGTVNAGASDIYVQRYDFIGGTLDWTRQFGTFQAEAGGIILNSPFVWVGATTTGSFPDFSNQGGKDIIVRKYGLDGNEIYTSQFGTDQDDNVRAIGKSADGSSIFIVGDTRGAFAGASNQGGKDFFVKRLGEAASLDPVELLVALIAKVDSFNFKQGILNSLDAKLNAALDSLEDLKNNNDVAAKNALEAFLNAVAAQRGNKIPEAEADSFSADAQQIIDLLNGA